MNYNTANEQLGKRDSRKVGNNTYLQRRDDGGIAVKLHATDVVTFYPDYFTLDTGGWYTVTTKDRINGFAPVRVYSEKGRWYVFPKYGDWQTKFPFVDGVQIDYDGNPLSDVPSEEDEKAAIKEASRIKRRISKYANLCVESLENGLPLPSGGDCWYCAMKRSNVEHLESHLEEGYVVPSLLWNAVTEAGYREPAFILGATPDGMGKGYCHGWAVKRSVSKYLKRRLLPNETGAKGKVAV